jgi:polyhydroxyalkanoate synthase subunit PhaC
MIVPPLGHIGMVVSAGAETGVWRPLADWLAATG